MDSSDNGLNALHQHITQLNKIPENLQGQLTSFLESQKVCIRQIILEAQKNTEKYLHHPIDIQQAIKSQFEPFVKQRECLQKTLEAATAYKLSDFSPLTKQIQVYQQSFRNIISPAFEELQRSFKELPPKIQEALLALAAQGWYLDTNMGLSSLWELKEALLNGKISEAEDALVEYFEERIEQIEQSITALFPHRAHIIESAFRAHKNEEYYLSIPVFLAQTDGICKEVFDQYLFMKKDKKPQTAVYVEKITMDTLEAALLSPLANTTPIGASEHERKEEFSQLNRHTVLHGESLNYGSKVNSLKAVSLINYVSQSLPKNAEIS